jgi:Pectinacetylesterase
MLVACSSSSGTSTPLDGGDEGGEPADAGVDASEDSQVASHEPITAPDLQWTWVPFPEAKCRDGSTTGLGVNLRGASTKVMIFLEGGGACFNAPTCGENFPNHFESTDFDSWKTGRGQGGIFNRNDAGNPVKDWSFVYVPYCTGDVHAGSNPAGAPAGLSVPQVFVGYLNVAAYLRRLVPTFVGATQVLLTGVSAGGFGAAANYGQVAKAFGSVPVDLLDDSGPPMADPYLATCLGALVKNLWSLDKTFIADCGADCGATGDYWTASMLHATKGYPNRRFGLVESTADKTISAFFGFGASNCTAIAPLSPDQFQAGLLDLRTKLAGSPNVGTFYFPGSDHTSIDGSELDSRTTGGPDGGTVKLADWIAALLAGTVSNAGP